MPIQKSLDVIAKKLRKKNKHMPTLTWIGKEKVVNHHQEVPYRVL